MRNVFRFLSFVAVTIAVTVIWANPGALLARDLSFEERVRAQEAIERVYYSHQTSAALPFEAVVPRALLEAKVRDYLGKSAALEHSPGVAITTQKLQLEQERIESRSYTPDRLAEIYAALGNDPILIQECFVRPVLVDRLSQTLSTPLENLEDTVGLDVEADAPVPGCTVDHWESMSTVNAPPIVMPPGVWTGNVLLVWGMDASGNPLGGRYNPLTDSWSPISTLGAPSPRDRHTAVWTGQHMIIWGGGLSLNSGGRYDPIADSWTSTSLVSAPAGRVNHTAVWTGNVMIVWGGAAGNFLNTGGQYNPESDTWSATTQLNAPSARFRHTAIWTGSRMIIWGGDSGTPLNTGGQYDPVADQWTPTTLTGSPTSRSLHTAIWTGSEMIVWGGFDDFNSVYFNTGGRYDPVADTWTPTSTTGLAATARASHVAVWDGIRMIVWGGSPNVLSRGGRYDPVTDTWSIVTMGNQPLAPQRSGAVAAWTGQQMLVWGGGASLTTGGRYFGDTATLDLDLDGFTACDGDCNDADATVHPGASETCNGVDDDCDGAVDQGLSVVLTPNLLRPANHKMINIVASVEARDACGSALPFVLTSITSSEPDDIPGNSDGSTVNDIQGASFGTSDTAFQLRAERDRLGSGRIYTVRYATTGSAGQQSSAEATVTVP